MSLRIHIDFISISFHKVKHQDKRRRAAPARTAPGVQTRTGTNGTGGPDAPEPQQKHTKHTRTTPGRTRTHQNTPSITKSTQATGGTGTNGTGGPDAHRDQRHRGSRRPRTTAKYTKNTRTTPGPHQDAPEHTRTHPTSPRALIEARKTQNSKRSHKVKQHNQEHTQRARIAEPEPKRTIHSCKPQRQEHHRLTRTHSFASHARTKRNDFLVVSAPNLRYIQIHSLLNVYLSMDIHEYPREFLDTHECQ